MQGSDAVAALLGAALLVPAQADAPGRRGDEPLSVGAVRMELAADDPVGRKKAGLICAPAGILRWREVQPAAGKAAGAVADAIRDAGVPITAADADDWIGARVPTGGYELIGDIIGLRVTMCAPAYDAARSVNHDRRLKGGGRMRVAWRIYRLADHHVVAQTQTCAVFAFDRPGSSGPDVGRLGLIENARVIGLALVRSPDAFTLPASLVTDEASCPDRTGRNRKTP